MNSVKSISFLWLGSLIGAGVAFLTQVFLARVLGAESFGLFASGLAMAMLIAPIASFGLGPYWLKVFGSEGWAAVRWIVPSLRLASFSIFMGVLILLLWGVVGPHGTQSRLLILFLAAHVAGQASLEIASSKLQLEERFLELAVWQFFPHITRLSLIFLAFIFSGRLTAIWASVAYSLTAILVVVLAIRMFLSLGKGEFDLKGHGEVKENNCHERLPSVTEVAKKAWPFGLAALSNIIYFQSDIVLIKYFTGDVQAGVYNVAFSVMAAVYLFPSAIFQKFFLPKVHRLAHQDKTKMQDVFYKGSWAMFGLGVIAALALWALAGWGVQLLFGDEYKDASFYINVLAASAPAMFVAYSAGAYLVTQEHMKLKVKIMLLVATMNLLLNFLFIPMYGALAAAVSTVLCQWTLATMYYCCTVRFVFGLGHGNGKSKQVG